MGGPHGAELGYLPVAPPSPGTSSVGALASGASAFIWAWDRRQRKELESLSRNQGVNVGRAVAGSAGKLPAKSVIHPVHPAGASSDEDLSRLALCYRESLAVAAGLGARSVGSPRWPGRFRRGRSGAGCDSRGQ